MTRTPRTSTQGNWVYTGHQVWEAKMEIPVESAMEKVRTRRLPSGRLVALTVRGEHEQLQVRSPQGEVEVEITLTEKGPVVSLRCASLEIESPERVSVRCRRFEVSTTESTELRSEGGVYVASREIQAKAQDDIRLDGEKIYLNCEGWSEDGQLSPAKRPISGGADA